MPFKLKLKKSRQYNVSSKNLFVLSVELLDNTTVECTLSSQSLGQECLNNVCQRLGLQQVFHFSPFHEVYACKHTRTCNIG